MLKKYRKSIILWIVFILITPALKIPAEALSGAASEKGTMHSDRTVYDMTFRDAPMTDVATDPEISNPPVPFRFSSEQELTAAEEQLKKNDAFWDGFLVKLSDAVQAQDDAALMEDTVSALSDTGQAQPVTGDVLLLHDEGSVADLLEKGTADYAEPNWEVELMDVTAEETISVIHGWAYEAMAIDAVRAQGLTGKGLRIGVIDSGVDRTHPDLENAVILEGYNYVEKTTEVTDEVGHGTRVTRLIVGEEDQDPVTGIAGEAEIVPLQCFPSSTTHVADLLQPITDAVDQYDCDIINMSWGLKTLSGSYSLMMKEKVEYAWEHGVVMVAATGNISSSYPAGSLLYPAAYDQVIGVGAVNQNLTVASYSQQTAAVYVAAPGTSVVDGLNGTSYACPCVSGAAALLLQEDPALTPAELMKKLQDYAVDLGEDGYDTSSGWGFLQMDRLVGHVVISLEIQEPQEKETAESEPSDTNDESNADVETPEIEILTGASADFLEREMEESEKEACGTGRDSAGTSDTGADTGKTRMPCARVGWHNPQSDQSAFLAVYDANGRMVQLEILDLLDERGSLVEDSQELEKSRKAGSRCQKQIELVGQAAEVRLMVLDTEGRPVEKALISVRS